MNQTIYIKASDCSEVEYPNIIFSDFLTVYCNDKETENDIKNLHFYKFDKEGRIVVSILKIIEMLQERYPSFQIDNLGEEDFIIEYKVASKNEKLKESLATFFICLVAFFGGGYAIIAYNTDVGAKELVLSALKKFNKEKGVTIVMVSSELEELRRTCDRIAIVSGGKVSGILPAGEQLEKFGELMLQNC